MTKTNKSYTKRLKQNPNGGLRVRTPGHNHFNSRQNGEERIARRRVRPFPMNNKDKGRFLPHN